MRRDAAGESNSTEFLRGAGTWHREESPKRLERPKGVRGRNTGDQKTEDSNRPPGMVTQNEPLSSEERLFI